MAKSTREEIKNRTAAPIVDNAAVSLEAEAERLKAEIEAGEDAPTPAQEIEREAQAQTASPKKSWAELRTERMASKTGEFAPVEPSKPIAHTKEVALVVESAYKQFLALGHGPETARSLANTYGILELAIVLNKIIGKV